MATTYKLSYFNFKGMGELPRYVLAQAGVAFENNRVTKEQWPQLKPNTPYGRMPVLEENGRQLGGGRVIARYLAEKPEFGLAGSNAFENAEIASIADVMDDLQKIIVRTHFEQDAEKKEAMKKEFAEKDAPKYFGIFQNLVRHNGGYLWGGKLTWVDLYYGVIMEFIYEPMKELFKAYPELIALKERVETLPNIAKYVQERPADHS